MSRIFDHSHGRSVDPQMDNHMLSD